MIRPIVLTRRVAASPDVVYSYLVESEKWSTWQGQTAQIEPTPGGLFLMKMPDGATARGEFVELIPGRKVVFTWGWVDHPGVPPGSSTVEIEIVGVDGGSMLTLTHTGLPEEEVETHTTGWEHYLTRLVSVAGGVDPGEDPGVGA